MNCFIKANVIILQGILLKPVSFGFVINEKVRVEMVAVKMRGSGVVCGIFLAKTCSDFSPAGRVTYICNLRIIFSQKLFPITLLSTI